MDEHKRVVEKYKPTLLRRKISKAHRCCQRVANAIEVRSQRISHGGDEVRVFYKLVDLDPRPFYKFTKQYQLYFTVYMDSNLINILLLLLLQQQ